MSYVVHMLCIDVLGLISIYNGNNVQVKTKLIASTSNVA